MFAVVLLGERDCDFNHVTEGEGLVFLAVRRWTGEEHVVRYHVTVYHLAVDFLRSRGRLKRRDAFRNFTYVD